MSVWETAEALEAYVYRSRHADLLRARRDWFEHLDTPVFALWWTPAGRIPDVEEAKRRLEHLQAHGPSEYAFTFRQRFAPGAEPIGERA